MSIYTGSGDRGQTSLYSGERVAKNHPYIEACGDVDELNSIIGGIKAVLPPECRKMFPELHRIQADLFRIGAYLATSRSSEAFEKVPRITEEDIQKLENTIDEIQAQLPKLEGFIIPNGHISAVMANIGRTVCRRAERHVVGLSLQVGLGGEPKHLRYQLMYLNRLSDYLFVLARHCNHVTGVPEEMWKAH